MQEGRRKTIYLCSPKVAEGTVALPVIKFALLKSSIYLDNYDTLICSSKQTLLFLNDITKEWREKTILAVGSQTAKVAKELGAKDIFFPKEFYGEELAKDIIKNFSDRKILYVRAKVVSFDAKAFLDQEGVFIDEVVLYKTSCIEYQDYKLAKNSIIIFTSPSTIECFFKSFQWQNEYRAVAIGKKTMQYLPKHINATLAKEPTIASCIETAQNL